VEEVFDRVVGEYVAIVDLTTAEQNFRRATAHCDNLIAVHRGHGGPAQGRRYREVSVNRAIVVLAVASWQAAVQDLTVACIDLSSPAPGGPLSPATYAVLAGRVKKETGDFSTPNAENSRRLLIGAGFDPRPSWTWSQRGGQGVGMVVWRPTHVETRMNEWLKVRHAIAHGHETLPGVPALTAVRESGGNPPADPSLRLVDAEQCLAFFRRVERLTVSGLAAHLGVPAPAP